MYCWNVVMFAGVALCLYMPLGILHCHWEPVVVKSVIRIRVVVGGLQLT